MSSDQKKLCLICGNLSPVDAVTCPHDGEATWCEKTLAATFVEASVEEQPSAEPPRRKKASR